MRKKIWKLLGLGFVSFTSCLAWSLYETKHPKIREYVLPILPENTKPINILHISDLHFRGKQSQWMTKWLSNLDLSNVDLVVSTGDNLGAENVNDELVAGLSTVLEKPGVFIFGSNDYYGPKKKNPFKYFFSKTPINKNTHIKSVVLDSEGLRKTFISAGWLDLNNSSGTLELPECTIEFVGVDDPHICKAVFPAEFTDPNKSQGVIRIGLAHAPYLGVIAEFARRNCDISFYGHTHGGQLAIPLYGPLVSNCDLPPVFASGVYSTRTIFEYVKGVLGYYDDKIAVNCVSRETIDEICEHEGYVSISAGLGVAPMFPLRFACPPEVSFITLVPKSNS